MTPRQISELVPMPELLRQLGIEVNERSHRTRCPIHAGTNPTAFRWSEDGRWYCYRCGVGGDRIELVRLVRKCGFKGAVDFLAALAGVRASRTSRQEIQHIKREREGLNRAASWLGGLERDERVFVLTVIDGLEWLKGYASDRLSCLANGEPELIPGEAEARWDDLALAEKELRWWLASYYVLAFGSERARLRFSIRPEERFEIVEAVMSAGVVTCEDQSLFEVPLSVYSQFGSFSGRIRMRSRKWRLPWVSR